MSSSFYTKNPITGTLKVATDLVNEARSISDGIEAVANSITSSVTDVEQGAANAAQSALAAAQSAAQAIAVVGSSLITPVGAGVARPINEILGDILTDKACGLKGDGTDTTDALEAAFVKASTESRVLRFTDGSTYTLTRAIAHTGGLVLRGNATFKLPHGVNAAIAITVPQTDIQSVSSITTTIYPAGSGLTLSALTVPDATVYKAGDIVLVHSDDSYPWEALAKRAELCMVAEGVGTTLYLAKKLDDTYTTGITVRKLSRDVVDIDGPTFTYNGDAYAATSDMVKNTSLSIYGAVNPRIKATFRDDISAGLYLFTCWKGDIDVVTENLRDQQAYNMYGYGVGLYGACRGTRVRLVAERVRHAFTTGVWRSSQPIYGGTVRDAIVYNSIATNCTSAAFDTHPGAFDTQFINCSVIGNLTNADRNSKDRSYAFQDRAVNTQFINCTARDVHSVFYMGTPNSVHGVPNTTRVVGGKFSQKITAVLTGLVTITASTADVCRIEIDGAYFEGYNVVPNVLGSVVLEITNTTFRAVPFLFADGVGALRFVRCTFDECVPFRIGKNNNLTLLGCKRINSATFVEPITLGDGSTITVDAYYAEAPSYGVASLVRATGAGTMTVNAGSMSAKGYPYATTVTGDGAGTLTINKIAAYPPRPRKGTTALRPVYDAVDVGAVYIDTTLIAAGKPIWWTGTAWVDATGVAV